MREMPGRRAFRYARAGCHAAGLGLLRFYFCHTQRFLSFSQNVRRCPGLLPAPNTLNVSVLRRPAWSAANIPTRRAPSRRAQFQCKGSRTGRVLHANAYLGLARSRGILVDHRIFLFGVGPGARAHATHGACRLVHGAQQTRARKDRRVARESCTTKWEPELGPSSLIARSRPPSQFFGSALPPKNGAKT